MTVNSLLDKLRWFDAYSKPIDDFRIQTIGGGLVAICCSVLVTLLVLFEVRQFYIGEVDEELIVDTTLGDRMRINMNITMHHISCSYVAVDSVDLSGEVHVNIHRNLFKRRVDLDGRPIKEAESDPGGAKKLTNTTQVALPTCGSCYGAETASRNCCNTCADVREAYMARGWVLPKTSSIAQCAMIALDDDHLGALNEGCEVYGYLDVSRVAGMFHLSAGRSFQMGHLHVHDLQPFSADEFNITNTIRHLSFGEAIEGLSNPLDGMTSVFNKGGSSSKYFLKIVPVMWTKLSGSLLSANRFSVTRHSQVVDSDSVSASPGLFFTYEFAPLMIKYSPKKKSWLHLATSICSIVGGVITVAGLLDAILFNSVRVLRKKMELGKQT